MKTDTKTFIKKAFTVRKKLIAQKKSYIDNAFASQFIKNFNYWVSEKNDISAIVIRHRESILYIIPRNFVKKFNEIYSYILKNN